MVFCRRYFLMAFLGSLLLVSPGWAQKRMIAHVTSPTGGFTSKLILANLTEASRSYNLQGFNREGTQIATSEGVLDPFETLTGDSDTLFSQQVSHVEITQAEGVHVTVEYQRDREGTGPAQVHESDRQAALWRIFPGNDEVTWDGIAVVNTGMEIVEITATQLDTSGNVIGGPRTVAQNLGSFVKVLYLFGNDFENVGQSVFEIEATGPIALTALRGNLASDYLWENKAFAIPDTNGDDIRMIAHVPSLNGGFRSQIIMANASDEEKTIRLHAFDTGGNQLRIVDQTLLAGQTLFANAVSLLGENGSHFEITGDNDVSVSMSYQADRENTGPAQVAETRQFSTSWRVYPGNQAVTWDGLAMINMGDNPTQIHVSQLDGNGSLLRGPIAVAEQLALRGKALYVFSLDFPSEAGAFFEINAGERLAVMAIRGNQGSDFIWQNTAVLQPLPGPAPTPPARIDYAFAYDPEKRVGIMVGGFDENFALLEDTWVWNGRRWRQTDTPASPLPRSHHGGTFNTASGQMVIFGGFRTQTQKRNDFMAFDGNNWLPFPGHPDIPAEDGELIYDSHRDVIVLAVPQDNSLQTWEFSNGAWARKMTATDPGRRLDQGFVYDAQNQRIFMFGGLTNGNAFSNETWSYDGQDWTKLNPTTQPPALIGMAMYYDTARQRIVSFGGMNASREVVNDTWVFENGNWRQLSPGSKPEPRWVTYAVYDAKRDMATIFAGEGMNGNQLLMYRDTWEFDGTNWHKR